MQVASGNERKGIEGQQKLDRKEMGWIRERDQLRERLLRGKLLRAKDNQEPRAI